MGHLAFTKYEGLGNDFIVVDARDESEVSPAQASRLCDRRRGVGADGVLLILPARTPDADARMRVLNADGSVPEMCGNGVRCVALHLARARAARRATLHIDTDAGPRACTVEDTWSEAMVTVDMGRVRVLAAQAIDVDGQSISFTSADAGNPHAVLLGAFAGGDIERLGPRIATHPEFPNGTNVEFARVSEGAMDLVVWERGVGITLACGTGACAAVAVGVKGGQLPKGRPVPVRLPGGTLEVTIDESGRATMRGPARRVFAGTMEL